jgi:uncharacterized repeat protein (TIGR01451 family)
MGKTSGRFRTLSNTVLSGALVASVLAVGAAPGAADPGDAPISAAAFVDLNSDGQWQPGEQSFVDYEAFAFDGSGNSVAGVLNATTGEFEFDLSGLVSGTTVADRYRVEFVNPDAPYVSGPMGTNTDPALPQSTSSTFFAGPGDTIYWGVHNPTSYCQDNPFLVTPCYVVGDQLTGGQANADVLVSIGYDWGNDGTNAPVDNNFDSWQVDASGTPNDPGHVAVASQMGTTWGEAWNSDSQTLYNAAFLKNFSGYGPGGPNAIYQTPMDPYTGQATGAPTVFATVGGADGITVCPDLHEDDLSTPILEPAVVANVGKCSFGDIDISNDNTSLYVMSLAGREVLEFDVASQSLTNSFPMLPEIASGNFADVAATCPDPDKDFRPFALGVHDITGQVFTGAMCVFEDDTVGELQAYVFTLDPATGTWTEVFATNYNSFRQSHRWLSNYAAIRAEPYPAGQEFNSQDHYFGRGDVILSDIEFFGDDLTLGFRSRIGDQLGEYIPDPLDPNPGTPNFIRTGSSGDLMCVWWDGSAYQQETSNACGPDRAVDPALITGLDPNGVGTGPGKGDWPADEFYWGDGSNWVTSPSAGFVFSEPFHTESNFGGLSQVNSGPLAYTSLNPPDAQGGQLFNTGGIGWIDPLDGSSDRAYLLYQSRVWEPENAFFGKANGLGDLEELCLNAPIEIGNYLWFDLDGDGIQDPDEPPVVGATVNLYDAAGTLIATAVSDANGHYVFNSAGPDGLPGNADDLFGTNEDLVLRMDNPADFTTGGPLDGWSLTRDSADDGSSGSADDQDSDATETDVLSLGAAWPEISHTTGGAGSNDHSLDFGYTSVFDLALRKQLADGTNLASVAIGDSVTFTIEVFNQGVITATDITVTDYLPEGLTLDDADWDDQGDGTATIAIPGPLERGDSTTVDITFIVAPDAAGTIDNFAEISDVTPVDGLGEPLDVLDIDSFPDGSDGDTNSDDEIEDDGDVDEDDHDGARLVLAPIPTDDPIFDLALIKTLADGTNLATVAPGSDVTFTITVSNQGEVHAENISVVDYLGPALTLADSNWTDNGDGTATTLLAGPLAPGGSVSVDITVTVDPAADGPVNNWAEISAADPTDGAGTVVTDAGGAPLTDVDSTPDAMVGNDNRPSGPEAATDDEVGQDGFNGGDEDDHDVAGVIADPSLVSPTTVDNPIFDLALRKQLADGTNMADVGPGDTVVFAITVLNQGEVHAENIVVTDYLPTSELTLADPAWTANGDGTASHTLAGPLAPGASAVVTISFTVDANAAGLVLNWAEISAADPTDGAGTVVTDGSGNPIADIDSVPNADSGDDNAPAGPGEPTDDEVGQDGFNGGDEDDHDTAGVNIVARLAFTGATTTSLVVLAIAMLMVGAAMLHLSPRRSDALVPLPVRDHNPSS